MCMHICVFVCDLLQPSLTGAASRDRSQRSVHRLFHTPLLNTCAHGAQTHKYICPKLGTLTR